VKYLKNTALLSVLAVLCSLSAFARDKNQHSVNLSDAVQVGNTQLQPGNYKVEWQGAGPDVQVNFVRNGKTVATVPGTLKTSPVSQDAVVTDNASSNKTLSEIDFGRDKQALVFQSGM
jgi:hypothetical protein